VLLKPHVSGVVVLYVMLFCARGLGLVGSIKESDGVDKWRQALLTLHSWLSTPKTARIVCYNSR
jgi:hypothetical protein